MVIAYPGGIFLMDESGNDGLRPGLFKTVAGVALIVIAVVVLLVFLSNLTAQPAIVRTIPNWTLVSYQDATGILIPVINTGDITIRFEQDGNITGFSGCNHYVAAYLENGEQMRITNPLHTSLVCPDAGIMQQEMTYYDNLAKSVSHKTGPSEIDILDAQGNTLLVFRRA
jgi:heat shock protein HslJ